MELTMDKNAFTYIEKLQEKTGSNTQTTKQERPKLNLTKETKEILKLKERFQSLQEEYPKMELYDIMISLHEIEKSLTQIERHNK